MSLGTYNFKLDDNRTAPIHVLTHKGREVWIAGEIGAALGYAEPKNFTGSINGEWSARFREGVDTFKVEGEELATLKRLVADSATSSPTQEPIIHPFARSLLLLTESGLIVALALTKTEAGDRFRWWLADEVLPSIRRTGSYTVAQGSGRSGKNGQSSEQGELFQVHPLAPFTPTSAPHVALKALGILRREGRIAPEHHHEQLAQLTSRITGMEVRLLPTAAQAEATSTEDGVACFLRERCVEDPGALTVVEDVFAAYQRYCAQRGYPAASAIYLGRLMGRFGYAHARHSFNKRQRRCVRGLRLLPPTIDITPNTV